MTSIGFNWNYGYQQNMQSSGLNYSGNSYFIQPQPQSLSGMGDPYDALSYGLGLIDSWSQPQQQYAFNQPQYNYNMNQTGFNSPFNYPQQQGDGSLASVLQSATAEYMMMMGQQMAIQQQLQGGINPSDPLAMNKMLGAQMQQIGGDLRDDGIINGSNQRPNPMQMMMQMMQMMMQMIMSLFGLGQQQQQPQQQYINPNDPMAMNKMMGARMEQMGGDLRDDGILNGSNQKPNPMQMMQQMMGMFMQMMMQMLGMGQQQQQQQPQQQYINPNDPMAMNKMLGAQMQRMGGDLKDDGILNGSNQRPQFPPQPMQMMQGMMMMFAGLDTMDNGRLDGSVFKNFLQA